MVAGPLMRGPRLGVEGCLVHSLHPSPLPTADFREGLWGGANQECQGCLSLV